LVYFKQESPEDANFADYNDKASLKMHIEDALDESHIIIITQIEDKP